MPRNRRADQCRSDVVEERGDHEHKNEEHESTGPIVGERGRHPIGNATCLEMAGEEREADEQEKQVGDQDPFMRKMGKETGESGALFEAVPKQLLGNDGAKTGECDRERMAMKNRNAGERDAEQEKIGHHGRVVSAERRFDGHMEDPARWCDPLIAHPENAVSREGGRARVPKRAPLAYAPRPSGLAIGPPWENLSQGSDPSGQPLSANGTDRLLTFRS